MVRGWAPGVVGDDRQRLFDDSFAVDWAAVLVVGGRAKPQRGDRPSVAGAPTRSLLACWVWPAASQRLLNADLDE